MNTQRVLHSAAFVLLLACVAARPFLNETTYRTAAIPQAFGAIPAPPDKDSSPESPDRIELARVSFAAGILLAVALWMVGNIPARRDHLFTGDRALAMLAMLFTVLSLASALCASNKRYALDAWLEQVSLLAAALLAAQLCADRRRFVMAIVVLAALAGTLAVKGAFQRWVEFPQTVEAFEKDRAGQLLRLGISDGSPRAVGMAARVHDPAVTGYIAMANVFVATLLVCATAAAGLAAMKIAAARKLRPAFHAASAKDEVHLPTVAAVVAVLLAIAGAVVLFLTRSTGGIAAFVIALPVCVLVYKYRQAVARRWKLCMIGFAALLLAGMAAVAACGLTSDSSATLGHARKTLLFRWLYWKASAEIVREHPLLGVGPANFSSAYLQHRDPRGEESVKNPHNFAAQALTEYGLPGGLCYLIVLGGMVVLAFRPSKNGARSGCHPQAAVCLRVSSDTRNNIRFPITTFILLFLSVLFARTYFAGDAQSSAVWVLNALMPAMAFAVMLVAAWWCSQLASQNADLTLPRVALGGGVAAFLLYEVISFNLTMPSAAAVFFLALGVLASRDREGAVFGHPQADLGVPPGAECPPPTRHGESSTGRGSLLAAGALAVVIVVIVILCQPVYERTSLTVEMQQAHFSRQWETVSQLATQAAQADTLDPLAAADAAKAWGLNLRQRPDSASHAYDWAKEAVRRDGQSASWWQLAAAVAMKLGRAKESLSHMEQAVKLDPRDLRLRLGYARMLIAASRGADALQELDAVEKTDKGLLPDSTERLSDAERREIAQLRKLAGGKP